MVPPPPKVPATQEPLSIPLRLSFPNGLLVGRHLSKTILRALSAHWVSKKVEKTMLNVPHKVPLVSSLKVASYEHTFYYPSF